MVFAEAEYGYQGLSQALLLQVQKEAYLMQEFGAKVQWHFYWSAASNSGGLSANLAEALINAGIEIVFHYIKE